MPFLVCKFCFCFCHGDVTDKCLRSCAEIGLDYEEILFFGVIGDSLVADIECECLFKLFSIDCDVLVEEDSLEWFELYW